MSQQFSSGTSPATGHGCKRTAAAMAARGRTGPRVNGVGGKDKRRGVVVMGARVRTYVRGGKELAAATALWVS